MNERHLTDLELAEALRAYLPAHVRDELPAQVAAALDLTGQQRAWPTVFGSLTDADPDVRRRAVLIAAAALVATAVAGAAAVGALRPWERTDPLRADVEQPAPPRQAEQPVDRQVGAQGLLALIKGGDLYVANPDGTGAVLVAHGDGSSYSQPRWSADGRWIAVQTPEPAILLFDTATGQMRRLAAGMFGDWSPSTAELALVTPDDDLVVADVAQGGTRLLVSRVNGSRPEQTASLFWYGNRPVDWSPDGRWLLMSRWPDPDGPLTLVRVDVDSGDVTPVATTDSWQLRGGWAPDSRNIVYAPYFERSVSDRFWIVDTERATTSEVVDPSGAVIDPVWSPDGAWIAYVSTHGSLVVVHPDETGRRTLAHGLDVGDIVGWRPDAAAIAYTRKPDEQELRELHLVTLADATDRVVAVADQPGDLAWADVPVTPPPPAPTTAPELPVAAPPAGEPLQPDATWGRMVVRMQDGDSDCGLAIIRFPGELVRVPRAGNPVATPEPTPPAAAEPTPGPQPGERCDLAFAPDGSAIAQIGRTSTAIMSADDAPASTSLPFTAERWSPEGGWLAGRACPSQGGDSCDSGRIIVRPDGTGRLDMLGDPTWSRDERVVVVATDDGTLLAGNGDGTDLHPIGTFPRPVALSPDGSRFAFLRDGNVWLAQADGSDVRNLSGFDLGGAVGAWWSPDGQFVAVLQGQAMWVFSPDGSVRQRIGTGLGSGTTGWGPEWAPVWSPDGRWLAIEHDDHVTLVSVDDWRAVRLEHAWQPAWSPNSRRLAVVTEVNNTYAVDVTNPDGSGRVTVWSDIAYPPVGWLR
jgi:hypothetical protein